MAELPIIIDATKAKSGSDAVVKAMQAMEQGSARSTAKMDELNRRLMFLGELGKAQVLALQSVSRSLRGLSETLIQNQQAWQAQMASMMQAKVVTQQVGAATDEIAKKTTVLGGIMKNVAGSALSFVAAFVGVQGIRIGAALLADYEEKMLRVLAVTRATKEEFKEMTEVTRELGVTTRFSASQAAEGLLNLAKNGFTASEALKALPATLNLALVAGIDLGQSSDIVANILAQFGLNASSTSRAVDDLAIIANASATTVTELAEALKYAGPVAGALGVSLEETVAVLGALGNAGIKASIGGTAIRGMFGDLLQPTEAAKKAIEALGLTMADLDPTSNNMITIFSRLKDAGFSAADAIAIFGRHQAAAALVLANSTEAVAEYVEKQRTLKGEAERIAKIVDSGLVGAWKSFISAVQELILKLGDLGLTSIFQALLVSMTHIIRGIAGTSNAFDDMGSVLAIVTQGLKAVLFLLIALAAQATISFFLNLTRAIQSTAGAMTILSTIAKVTPFVLAATAILTLAEAMGVFRSKTESATNNFATFADQAKAVVDQIDRIGAARARASQVGDDQGRLKALEDESNQLKELEITLIALRTRQQQDVASAQKEGRFGNAYAGLAPAGIVGADKELTSKLRGLGLEDEFGGSDTGFFDVDKAVEFLRKRTAGNEKVVETLRDLLNQQDAAEKATKEIIENRSKAGEALRGAGVELDFERMVSGLSDLDRATAEYHRNLMKIAEEGNLLDKTLPPSQIAATQAEIAALTEEFRGLKAAQGEARFIEEFDALIERLQTETALLKLSNDERIIAIEIQRAEEAAKRNGVALTKEEYELVRKLTEERERAKAASTLDKDLNRLLEKEERKELKDVFRKERDGSQRSTDILGGVALSSQFTGVAESFRLNREPLTAIQLNTKKMSDTLERIEKNKGSMPRVNVRIGSGVR